VDPHSVDHNVGRVDAVTIRQALESDAVLGDLLTGLQLFDDGAVSF
jgi:hypothetical protein